MHCISKSGLEIIINPTDAEWLANPYSNQDLPGAPVLLTIEEPCKTLLALHLRYAKRAIAAFSGRNRNTFVLNDRLVVKLPRGADGCMDNDWEGSVSNSPESIDQDDYVQYPHTKLVFVEDIPVVFMQKIQPLTSRAIKEKFGYEPDWVFSVDCGQVGTTRFGRLVAYDYGVR